MEIKNIAKLSSYGAYLDEEFIYTNSLVEGKNVIVGNIAEYVYDLEQTLIKKGQDIAMEIYEKVLEWCPVPTDGSYSEFIELFEQWLKEKYGLKTIGE